MTWILVLIIMPGNVVPGSERHTEFPSEQTCRNALSGITLPNWDHIKYCVPKGSDDWFYPNLKPGGSDAR